MTIEDHVHDRARSDHLLQTINIPFGKGKIAEALRTQRLGQQLIFVRHVIVPYAGHMKYFGDTPPRANIRQTCRLGPQILEQPRFAEATLIKTGLIKQQTDHIVPASVRAEIGCA